MPHMLLTSLMSYPWCLVTSSTWWTDTMWASCCPRTLPMCVIMTLWLLSHQLLPTLSSGPRLESSSEARRQCCSFSGQLLSKCNITWGRNILSSMISSKLMLLTAIQTYLTRRYSASFGSTGENLFLKLPSYTILFYSHQVLWHLTKILNKNRWWFSSQFRATLERSENSKLSLLRWIIAQLLKIEDEEPSLLIACPTVLRNQRLWRHKSAPVMGKWAIDRQSSPGICSH